VPRRALRVPGPAVLGQGATWHGEDRRAKGGEAYRAEGLDRRDVLEEVLCKLGDYDKYHRRSRILRSYVTFLVA